MSDSKVTIKTARAWVFIGGSTVMAARLNKDLAQIEAKRLSVGVGVPVSVEAGCIVHGLTESEVHEAAALLAKSREVCPWKYVEGDDEFSSYYEPVWHLESQSEIVTNVWLRPHYCPVDGCGRRVSIKEA